MESSLGHKCAYDCVYVCMRRRQDTESAMSTMQMPPINTALTALTCIQLPFEYIHFAHIYISRCVSVECNAGECCVDSLGVTEVVAACFERQVFTRSEHNKKQIQRTREACQCETGDQSANNKLFSATVSLLVYGYRLMSPLAPPQAPVGGE